MISQNNLRKERFKYGWKYIKGHKESDSALVRKTCNQFSMRSFLSNLCLPRLLRPTTMMSICVSPFYIFCPFLNSNPNYPIYLLNKVILSCSGAIFGIFSFAVHRLVQPLTPCQTRPLSLGITSIFILFCQTFTYLVQVKKQTNGKLVKMHHIYQMLKVLVEKNHISKQRK